MKKYVIKFEYVERYDCEAEIDMKKQWTLLRRTL